MRTRLYLEGGAGHQPRGRDLNVQCRAGFHQLLERSGLAGRCPRLVACGSRSDAFARFKADLKTAAAEDFVALLVDSEEPVGDLNQPWAHLAARDGWSPPAGAEDQFALLMVTCMETWIVADRKALRTHYGSDLRESALPPLRDLEQRSRDDVQTRLARSTSSCSNAYRKGRRSFELLAKLDPAALRPLLPSFARCVDVLASMMPPAATSAR